MRYKTLSELQAAYASGDDLSPVILDNDTVDAYSNTEVNDHGEDLQIYHSDPWAILREALTLLNIPWDGA
jgi:hypothetical protein